MQGYTGLTTIRTRLISVDSTFLRFVSVVVAVVDVVVVVVVVVV